MLQTNIVYKKRYPLFTKTAPIKLKKNKRRQQQYQQQEHQQTIKIKGFEIFSGEMNSCNTHTYARTHACTQTHMIIIKKDQPTHETRANL